MSMMGRGHGPFGRGPMGPPVAHATDAKATFGRLLGRLKRQWPGLIAVGIFTSLSVFLSVLGPRQLGAATNVVFEGVIGKQLPSDVSKEAIVEALRAEGRTDFANMLESMNVTPGLGVDFAAVGYIIGLVILLYIGAAIFGWMSSYIMSGIAQRAIFELRRDVEMKLSRVPLKYVDGESRGDLLSRVTNDIDNIGNTLQQGLSQLLNNTLQVIGGLAMMFLISPLLAVISLIVIPLSFFTTTFIGKRSQKEFANQWRHTGELNGHVEETHTGHAIVLAFGQAKSAQEKFEKSNDELFEASFKASFLSGLIQPVMQVLANFNYVAIAVIGALRVTSGSMSLGDVQAFIQYSRQFTMPLTGIAAQMNQLQSGIASAERVFAVIDAVEEKPEPRGSMALIERPRGHVVFDNVAFRYVAETPLIHDFSLDVKPGQTVAIVGPTGAGKTTMVNLLMRFYDIDEGSITIDGVNTSEMAREDVRSLCGMVLQDTWLFGGTIRDNIGYGNPTASDEDIYRAARNAHADRFIRTLPDGYDTIIEDDAANLSVGERQLLTIARAFVADPTILILDEATSSVDTRTELLIQTAMNRLREGRTSFVIAHRLSTIRDADVIVVMKDGAIVETGNHHYLIARQGHYADLYRSQFEAPIV